MRGSANSSLQFWTPFDSITTAIYRELAYSLSISWLRQSDITAFATVGSTVVGGLETVKGDTSNIFTASDQFQYFNETEYMISASVSREVLEPLGGFAMAQADIVLDNSTLRFTPEYNSTIGTALLPNRPMRVKFGFVVNGINRTLNMINALTELPRENKANRQVTIHAYDYMTFINEVEVEEAIYIDKTADEIIESILTDAGFGTSQYQLDTGLNSIGFLYTKKGDKAGNVIRRLCEAEEAQFYQDEDGLIRFDNRNTYRIAPRTTSQWTINANDIYSWDVLSNTKIYNRVEVKAKPRSVKATTEVWRDPIVEEIPAGDTVTIWANYQDPVTTYETITSTTDYIANSASDGSGSDLTANIDITPTHFTDATKLVIENTGATTAYMTLLRLRGTPATVDYNIEEAYQDDSSVSKYGESVLTVQNDYIDSYEFARYLTRALVNKYNEPRTRLRLIVQAIPQLQLMDRITVYDQDLNTTAEYRVMKIKTDFNGSELTQTLEVREIGANEAEAWAIVGFSTVDGDDAVGE